MRVCGCVYVWDRIYVGSCCVCGRMGEYIFLTITTGRCTEERVCVVFLVLCRLYARQRARVSIRCGDSNLHM